MNQQFVAFLESLKTEENTAMIEAIMEGYTAIALTESYTRRLPKEDRNNAEYMREIDKLYDAVGNVGDIMSTYMNNGTAIIDKVSNAIGTKLANRTFDGEIAGILKENFQKIEGQILANPNLSSDKRFYIENTFDRLYNQLFRVADEIGYAM